MLRLTVPKRVELKNRRLRILYNILQVAMVVIITVRFVGDELWVNHIDISRHMAAEIWATGGDAPRLADVWAQKESSPLCSSPSIFDFSWDETFAYRGHECLRPCGAEGAAAWPRCVYDVEIVRREAEDRIFFVTQFEERRVGDAEAEPSFAFVPLEEAHGMSFRYGYSVKEPSWLGFGTGVQDTLALGSLQPPGMLQGGSDGVMGDGILTVLLDSTGGVQDVLETRPTIDLSVSELLALAGLTGALDEPNRFAGPNVLEGTQFPEGGLGRITGLNIDIKIECERKQREPLPGRAVWSGPVCYVRAERSMTRAWATWEFVAASPDGGLRQRLNHGLRVQCVMSGRMDFFDADQVFLQISSSLVFISLPNMFMFFFIIHAMGHLSKIYRSNVVELFDIPMECARLTARLMSNSVTFVELEDIGPDESASLSDTGCISKRRVREQLQEVMRYRGSVLDEREMRGLVDYCHDAVLKGGQLGIRPSISSEIRNLVQDICPRLGHRFRDRQSERLACERQERTGSKSNDITIDDFSMCCAASEKLQFEAFVALFDEHRGITLLEHFFLPHRLRPLALCHSEPQDGTIPVSEGGASTDPDAPVKRKSLFNLRERQQAKMDSLLHRDDSSRRKQTSSLSREDSGSRSRISRPVQISTNSLGSDDDLEHVFDGVRSNPSKESTLRSCLSNPSKELALRELSSNNSDPEWQRASHCLGQLGPQVASAIANGHEPPPPSPDRARRRPSSPSPELTQFHDAVEERTHGRKFVAFKSQHDPPALAAEVEDLEKSETLSHDETDLEQHIPGAVDPLHEGKSLRESDQWGDVQLA